MPEPRIPRPRENDVYRVTLDFDPHQWSFVFAPHDADTVIARIGELMSDPAAPLEPEHAEVLSQQVARLGRLQARHQSGPEIADRTAEG